jgi:prepilin-type N-terminal cleavage/methylation domain-containing protein
LAVPNQGWSLLEMAVVSVIVGILASMAIPSMMSGMGKNQLQSSMGQVKGAIQEAQRAAIKNGQSCTVTITGTTVSGSPAGCISSPITSNDTSGKEISLKILSSGSLVTPPSGTEIVFSYKGNTTNTITIVLASTKTTTQTCLAISSGIGIMRSGTYSGGNCNSSF